MNPAVPVAFHAPAPTRWSPQGGWDSLEYHQLPQRPSWGDRALASLFPGASAGARGRVRAYQEGLREPLQARRAWHATLMLQLRAAYGCSRDALGALGYRSTEDGQRALRSVLRWRPSDLRRRQVTDLQAAARSLGEVTDRHDAEARAFYLRKRGEPDSPVLGVVVRDYAHGYALMRLRGLPLLSESDRLAALAAVRATPLEPTRADALPWQAVSTSGEPYIERFARYEQATVEAAVDATIRGLTG